MRLTETDVKMFKALSHSEIGKQLVDYLRRLQGDICDSRNWGEGDTREGSIRLAKKIEDEVCVKITQQNEKKSSSDQNYE